jgi:hypothetical protein
MEDVGFRWPLRTGLAGEHADRREVEGVADYANASAGDAERRVQVIGHAARDGNQRPCAIECAIAALPPLPLVTGQACDFSRERIGDAAGMARRT